MQSNQITISVSDLTNIVRQAVRMEVEVFKDRFYKTREKKHYTRKETKHKLGVAYSTLYLWDLNGTLKANRRGIRVYYSSSEVDNFKF